MAYRTTLHNSNRTIMKKKEGDINFSACRPKCCCMGSHLLEVVQSKVEKLCVYFGLKPWERFILFYCIVYIE